MSAEPKPMELTEAEMDAIIKAFFPFDHSCAHNCGPVFDVIEGIIATREAAARREALLEACGEVQRRMDGAELADGGKLQTWDALAGVMEWIEEKA